MNSLSAAMGVITGFLDLGGGVLVVIMVATFILWALILERLFYFAIESSKLVGRLVEDWDARKEHRSWYALAVRERMISQVRLACQRNMIMIKAIVAIAPLLGLLGTVTGMVEVFDVMAATGSSNARLMAAGISKATIPTMSGLVASLSGVLLVNYLLRKINRTVSTINDKLLIE